MSMRTIQTEGVVRRDPSRGKKEKNLEDVPLFDEEAWCQLCELAYVHTLLIDKIGEKIKKDPDLLNWILATQDIQPQDSTNAKDSTDTEPEQHRGWLPKDFVKELCNSFAKQPPFKGMSSRFYSSATKRVKETFNGWFQSKQKLINKIKGKQRYLRSCL